MRAPCSLRTSSGLLLLVLLAARADGQPPPPLWPGDAQEVGPAPRVELSAPAMLPPPGSAAPLPGPPAPLPPPPGGVVYPFADPGPDGWGPYGPPSAEPLFYFNWDVAVVTPSVKNGLHGTVPLLGGGSSTVAPPAADLGWTVSPRFELGYRLPESQGAFQMAYQFLIAEGDEVLATSPTPTSVRSRLNVNVFDFDYITPRYTPYVRWDVSWLVGARLATAFYDTTAQVPFVTKQASNYFVGGGAHLGMEVQREIAVRPGLALFGRVDGSVIVGTIEQHYRDRRSMGGTVFTGQTADRESQTVPTLRLEAGLSYTPPEMCNLRFLLGYRYEHWWNLGKIDDTNLELTSQGVFLRGEISY